MEELKLLIVILLSAVFVDNYVLSRFLGICPFLGVSKKTETAAGMGGAVIFVIGIASLVTTLEDISSATSITVNSSPLLGESGESVSSGSAVLCLQPTSCKQSMIAKINVNFFINSAQTFITQSRSGR